MNMSKMSMGKIPLFTEISEVAQVVLGAGVTQLETRGTQKFPRNFFFALSFRAIPRIPESQTSQKYGENCRRI